MSSAEFDLKNGGLIFGSPAVYEIKTWRPSRVTGIREHPCGTASMTIDVDAKAVTIVSVPHADLPFCGKEPASIWTLVDGFPVIWKIHQDSVNSARLLVYEPARRLVSPVQPYVQRKADRAYSTGPALTAADDLPDAPWASTGEEVPAAPWASEKGVKPKNVGAAPKKVPTMKFRCLPVDSSQMRSSLDFCRR
jgi:hypothetical protein